MNKRTDKRLRLIEAADKLFFEQGVNVTTLAHIAALSEVPLGNVYYYFKSKESIVLAVIEARRKAIQQQFDSWNNLGNSEARLKSFIEHNATYGERTASFGDWLGSMCQELCKSSSAISTAASDLLKEVFGWCENQFKNMGKGERSHMLALSLLSGLQGTNLLTLTFKDPNLTKQQSEYLINWLDNSV